MSLFTRHGNEGQESLAGPLTRRHWVVSVGETRRPVTLSPSDGALDVELTDEGRSLALRDVKWRPGAPIFRGVLDGRAFALEAKPAAEGFVLRQRAATERVLVLTPLSAELHERLPKRPPADTSKMIISPMPGLVVAIEVKEGQEVKEGETVAIIEAMKMQNIIKAERDGTVKSVGAKAGDSVAADEVLVEFA